LISEMDQRKFGSIEQLIGKEVDKVPVPEFLGLAPVYDPKRKTSGGPQRGSRSGRKQGPRRHNS
jgi:hypothetical protein